MSHYTEVRLEMSDQDALVAALNDLGLKKVEVHDAPQVIHGFDGQIRHAEVIVRNAGHLSNDIGFLRGPDGNFQAVLDDYDLTCKFTPAWRGQLLQRYGRHVAVAKLKKKGFRVVREENRDGRIHLVMGRSR
jgi:hypothetical protein